MGGKPRYGRHHAGDPERGCQGGSWLLRLALRGAVWVRLRGPTAGAAHIKEIFHRSMQKKESRDRAQTRLT